MVTENKNITQTLWLLMQLKKMLSNNNNKKTYGHKELKIPNENVTDYANKMIFLSTVIVTETFC